MTLKPRQRARIVLPRFSALFILAVLFALFAAGCGDDEKAQEKKSQEEAAVTVKAMFPEKRDAPIYAEFTGRTDAQETVEIRARVQGFLKERAFEEGGLVKKGDLLFVIESRQYDEDLNKAEADLAREEALLAKARLDMQRFGKLYEQRAVSRDEYDSKMTNQKQLEASVARNKAAVETAKRDLGYTRITAPISGRIGKSKVKVGSLVGKGENTLLAEISSTDPIYVDFSISEREYLSLAKERATEQQNGQEEKQIPLTLILADDSVYPLEGRADMADRAVDAKTGTLGVRGVFPNPDGILKPGQFAKIRALIEVVKGALCVPLTAVMDVQGTKSLYVVGKDGKAESKPVTLGGRVDDLVVVQKGIDAEDQVVVEGGMKLRPGAPVKVEAPAKAGEAEKTAAPQPAPGS